MSRSARTWLVGIGVLGVFGVVWVLLFATETQSFRAKSGAMEPTLDINERFTVNQEAYDDAGPERRDIVVFRPPQGAVGDSTRTCGVEVSVRRLCPRPTRDVADVMFVKRVIGLPGERLGIEDGRAVIDGEPLEEPYANLDNCLGSEGCSMRGTIAVPEGHYFLMGDNRGASDDSRFWGPVPREQIDGRLDDCLPFGLRCTEDDRTG